MQEKEAHQKRWHVSAQEADALPIPPGRQSALVLEHGTLEVRHYAPRGSDPQTPHTRDEVYVVINGTGWFVNGESRRRFQPHDMLFVPAGAVHHFEDFSDDFATWVVFYGPEGGE